MPRFATLAAVLLLLAGAASPSLAAATHGGGQGDRGQDSRGEAGRSSDSGSWHLGRNCSKSATHLARCGTPKRIAEPAGDECGCTTRRVRLADGRVVERQRCNGAAKADRRANGLVGYGCASGMRPARVEW